MKIRMMSDSQLASALRRAEEHCPGSRWHRHLIRERETREAKAASRDKEK